MKQLLQAIAIILVCAVAISCTQISNEDDSQNRNLSSTPMSTSVTTPTVSTSTATGTTLSTETTAAGEQSSLDSSSTTLQAEFPNSTETLSPDPIVTSITSTTTEESSETETASSKTTTTTTTTTSETLPSDDNEVKAVWISYLEYNTMLKGKTQQQFTANVQTAFDNIVDLGLNTVIIHARAHGDAYYDSDLFPWAKRVTGTFAAVSSFDPLEIMIKQARSRGLSVHAWINPMRLMKADEITLMDSSYTVRQWYNDASKRGTYIVEVGGYWYLNPAYSEVRSLIADGAAEIVSNYDVDALHIDDYFYPTTNASFDSAAFSASGASTLSTWRIGNTNKMVKALYNAVKAANSRVLFGVSPQGNVSNNYNNMYADVRTWCSTSGYLDYIAPQIYYGFENQTQPYEQVLKAWNDMTTASGVTVIPGLAVYKIGTYDQWAGTGQYEWENNDDIIERQVLAARAQSKYGGFVLYRYDSIFKPASSVQSQVEHEIDQLRELID